MKRRHIHCWSLHALLLICSAPIHASSGGHCPYGSLPGRWVDAPATPDNMAMYWPPTGKRQIWKTFSRRCQLFPLADSLIGRNTSQVVSPAKILFLGDSTDRLIQQDVCDWGAALGSPVHHIGFKPDQTTLQVPVINGKAQNFSCDHCSGCMTNFATMGHMYVFGVDPVGPYHTGKHGGWPTRVPEVIREYKRLTEGQNPDLLVFASNFWDIATYTTKNASKLVPEDLEVYVLEEFQENLSSVLSAVEGLVGHSTIKAFKTSAWVEAADCTGTDAQKPYLGKRAHIAQLNAAGKHIAMSHGWDIVDLEPIVAKFGNTNRYLRDAIHPQMFFNVEIFNIYLNILRDHGRLYLASHHEFFSAYAYL